MGARVAALCALLWLVALPAVAHVSSIESHAHQPGTFFTAVSLGQQRVDVLFTAPRLALQQPGQSSPGDAASAILPVFRITNGDGPCEGRLVDALDYSAIDAWQYELSFDCADTLSVVQMEYEPPVENPWHTNTVEIQLGPHFSFAQFDWQQTSLDIPVDEILWREGWTLPAEPAPLEGRAPSIFDYFQMGFVHVLSGFDHLAFLLGLLILVVRLRDLIVLITSFTVAHSITLAISALDIVTLNVAFTEAAIALTIVYIGAENLYELYRRGGEPLVVSRWITTFIFGLIHGFGFSFLLREIGLPPDDFVVALLLFNIGVEAAQISVVVIPFLIARHFLRRLPQWPWIAAALSTGVIAAGAWWLIERTML